MARSRQVHPVLLAGGAGARLWPLSRGGRPKPFLSLVGPASLFQQTLERMAGLADVAAPIVVAGEDHRFVVAEQLRASGRAARVVLEPAGRNTAFAAAVGALLVLEADPEGLMLMAPTDHLIPDAAAFCATIASARPAAEAGRLVLVGVAPTRAETGYGYIRKGAPLDGAFEVAAFLEKPDAAKAQGLWSDGAHLWNGGMVLARAGVLLAEIEALTPATAAAARAAVAGAARDPDFLRLDAEAVAAAPAVSLDTAVLEKTAKAAVVAASFAWADIGSWSSLWALAEQDRDANVALGDTRLAGVRGSYVRSEGPLVAVVGVEDLVVVATAEAVLVARRGDDAAIKALAERLDEP